MRKSKRQVGAVNVSEIEALVSNDSEVFLAGSNRLEDIGEASTAYLAKEAFVAMVEVAIRLNLLRLVPTRRALQDRH